MVFNIKGNDYRLVVAIDAIKFRMEQMELTKADMVQYLFYSSQHPHVYTHSLPRLPLEIRIMQLLQSLSF